MSNAESLWKDDVVTILLPMVVVVLSARLLLLLLLAGSVVLDVVSLRRMVDDAVYIAREVVAVAVEADVSLT